MKQTVKTRIFGTDNPLQYNVEFVLCDLILTNSDFSRRRPTKFIEIATKLFVTKARFFAKLAFEMQTKRLAQVIGRSQSTTLLSTAHQNLDGYIPHEILCPCSRLLLISYLIYALLPDRGSHRWSRAAEPL